MPGGPSTPAPSGPRAPGGGGAAPSPPSGSGPRTPASADLGVDLYDWLHWWQLERDAYLDLRARVQRAPARVEGRTDTGRHGRAPSDLAIGREVVPRLLRLLETERDDDVVTGALLALARLDPPDGTWGAEVDARIHTACTAHLASSSQAVAETAALALGLLGGEAQLAALEALLADDATGRALTGAARSAVSTRTRVFAAFGLGLLGAARDSGSAADAALRQRISLALIDALESGYHASHDLPVAALISLGLCPLPPTATILRGARDDERALHVIDVHTQLAFVGRWLQSGRGAQSDIQRAHGMVAAARLARVAREDSRLATVERLAAIARDIAESESVRAAAALALGEVAHSGIADRGARDGLLHQARKGRNLERRFALIALARVAARPGPDAEPLDGEEDARRQLLTDLSRGRSGDRPWIALALGVLEEQIVSLGGATPARVTQVLTDLAAHERSAHDAAAFSIALALAARGTPETVRVGKAFETQLQRLDDPVERGQVLVAAGLVGRGFDEGQLRESLRSLRYQPAALWGASVALGLVGDAATATVLVELLRDTNSTAARAALASALGVLGDDRCIAPITKLLDDPSLNTASRAFLAVALGTICDRDALPWRYPIAHAFPYFASTPTLVSNGDGLLELL